MLGLSTLIKMQIKEKIDLSWIKSKKTIITKVVFAALAFTALTAVVYFLLYLSRYLQLFSLVGIIPSSVISFVFGIMIIIFSISCAFSLSKNLYFARENFMLLTLPVKHNTLYLSKLIVYYIYSLIKNSMIILPFFVGYGIFTAQAFYYYPWILFCFIFVCALIVLIGAVLSLPIMYFSKLFKSYKVLQYIGYCVSCLAIVALVIMLISLIPENIDFLGSWGTTYWQIQAFLSGYIKYFAPIYYLTLMIIGKISVTGSTLFSLNTLIYFSVLLGLIVLLFLFCYISARPLFLKMASQPFEYKKNMEIKERKNKKNPLFISLIKKEFLINIRSSELMYNNLTLLFVLPVAMLLLNKIFAAMNTGALGNNLVISFNVLIILLIALNSNYLAASIYSREGRAGYLNKIQPTNYSIILFSKLFYKIVLSIFSVTISCIIISHFSNFNFITATLFTLGINSIILSHLFWSAGLDIMNPQNEKYAESTTLKNPNEIKSTMAAFLISFLLFAITFLLIPEGKQLLFIKWSIISVVILGYVIYMFFKRIRLYYKEK